MTETKHTSQKTLDYRAPHSKRHQTRSQRLLRLCCGNCSLTAELLLLRLHTPIWEPNLPPQPIPSSMLSMREAVAVIEQALQADENITIYGDYDTDGVTASSLLFEFFNQLRHEPRVYIPNRFDEGYGLNLDAVELLAAEGTQLLITVDCGIRSLRGSATGQRTGHARDCYRSPPTR